MSKYEKGLSTLCLIVNDICNKDCRTCISRELRRNNKKTKPNIDIIDLLLPDKINKYKILFIGGGEPGLLPFEEKVAIIDKIKDFKHTVTVLTNGTNIEDWFKIDTKLNINFMYHITDIEDTDVIERDIPFFENARYQLIISPRVNLTAVSNLIEKYPNYDWIVEPDEIDPIDKETFKNFMLQNLPDYFNKKVDRITDGRGIKISRKLDYFDEHVVWHYFYAFKGMGCTTLWLKTYD